MVCWSSLREQEEVYERGSIQVKEKWRGEGRRIEYGWSKLGFEIRVD